jgi:hypothetical protein
MTDWVQLSQRAGLACHDLVGWILFDPKAAENYAALGIPDGKGYIVACRLAALGDVEPSVGAAACYSIHPGVIDFVMGLYRAVADGESIMVERDAAVLPGLASFDSSLAARLAPFAGPLWTAIDSLFAGARPMFAAHRSRPRPDDLDPGLSAWLAVNCLREFRGDNHWALCASEGLEPVDVGLLHTAMVSAEDYEPEWIARSRGAGDDEIGQSWQRLAERGFAADRGLTDAGREFRHALETRTDVLTAPAWRALGEELTVELCELVEPLHDGFVARIDATAGPNWMPAVRVTNRPR